MEHASKTNLGEIPCKVYDIATKEIIHRTQSISQCAKDLGVELNWVRSAVTTSPDPYMNVQGRLVKRRGVKHARFFSPTFQKEVTVRVDKAESES